MKCGCVVRRAPFRPSQRGKCTCVCVRAWCVRASAVWPPGHPSQSEGGECTVIRGKGPGRAMSHGRARTHARTICMMPVCLWVGEMRVRCGVLSWVSESVCVSVCVGVCVWGCVSPPSIPWIRRQALCASPHACLQLADARRASICIPPSLPPYVFTHVPPVHRVRPPSRAYVPVSSHLIYIMILIAHSLLPGLAWRGLAALGPSFVYLHSVRRDRMNE
mmetsp:Transcript_20852/g.50850  ORF Transcript_20852/g.50850 Transcript_20852/m.50850 type:complete len:219 (+) Transcript_20852:2567-3223(+)